MAQAWLFTGDSSLALQRAVDNHVAQLRSKAGDREVFVEDVYGSEIRDDQMPDLRSMDIFGSQRIYVIRNAETMSPLVSNGIFHEIEKGELEAELVLSATKTASLRKISSTLKKLGGLVQVETPNENNINAWTSLIVDEFNRHGLKADNSAITALLDAAGTNLDSISEKVSQVSVSLNNEEKKQPVSAEKVEQIVVGHGSKGAFTVANYMLAGDKEKAIIELRGCLDAGEEPLRLLGAFTYVVRQFISVTLGVSTKDGGVYAHPGQANELRQYMKRFMPGEVTLMVNHLAACDLEIKSGYLGSKAALERCVLSIASSPILPVPDPDREILR